jgi:hypothetical protein
LVILPNTGSSISGKVADLHHTPFQDVLLTLSSGLTMTTDTNGEYAFNRLLTGTYTLTPSHPGFTFSPPARVISLPPSGLYQNFTILPAPVSTQVLPGIGGNLTYTDTQGLPTQLSFSSLAVTQTTTMTLTPTLTSGGSPFAFAGHAFDLSASQAGISYPGFTFDEAVWATIHYSDQDVWGLTSEDALSLFWWTGSSWQDAANTCDPPLEYIRDTANNIIGVPFCKTGSFTLVGPTIHQYIPLALHYP